VSSSKHLLFLFIVSAANETCLNNFPGSARWIFRTSMRAFRPRIRKTLGVPEWGEGGRKGGNRFGHCVTEQRLAGWNIRAVAAQGNGRTGTGRGHRFGDPGRDAATSAPTAAQRPEFRPGAATHVLQFSVLISRDMFLILLSSCFQPDQRRARS
jgi:hypothetical protein